MEHLTAESFRSKIFDYKAHPEWHYSGALPVIIDFYAEWCVPCRALAPVMEEIAKEYSGKIEVYKVNTDSEPELSSVFGVQGLPSILFIPTEGQPQMAAGAMTKEELLQAVREVLKV